MTMEERCFICGSRMGRGNQPTIGKHERMNKLVSVSQNVEHSSTIISDILSRILNETVMHEESICRICFNLLNDIDYHLKEAQEKTDEITNKFLDKGKNPLSYKPQPIVTANITNSSREEEKVSSRSSHAKKSHRKRFKEDERLLSDNETDSFLTEDEMSVNIINKNKAKLLSHVLNPKSKSRHDSNELQHQASQQALVVETDFEEEEVLEEEEDDEELYEPVVKKRKKPKKHHSKKSSSKKVKHDKEEEEEEENISGGDKAMFFAKKSDPPSSSKTHDTLEAITCPKCKKVFKKKSNLELHLEKMHGISQAPLIPVLIVPESHKCDLCPREFTNENSLLSHKSEHILNRVKMGKSPPKTQKPSEGDAKAVCPQCNKTFRRMFNMRTHVDRVHNRVRPFPCKYCQKAFATNSDLKQHMITHGEGKTFKCEECDRTFSNRDSIIFHRKQHSNQRSHFCKICDKGFFKASCLNRHMRSHTGERPFKCSCGKGFSQSSTLKVHKEKCIKMDYDEESGNEILLKDINTGMCA